MIRQNQRAFNLLLVLIDMVVISFSLVLAWFIRFQTNLLGFGQSTWGFNYYMASLLFVIPIYFMVYYVSGLYKPQRTKSIRLESLKIIRANFIGLFMIVTVLFIIGLDDYSRYMIALFAIFSTSFSIIERLFFRFSLRYIRGKGFNIKYILIIGAGVLGRKISPKIEENEYLGYNIIGFLDDNVKKGNKIGESEVIGKIKDLEDIISENQVDRVIIAISPRHYDLMEQIVDICEKDGVKAEIVPDYYRYFPAKPYIDMIEDIPIIDIRYVPLDNTFKKIIKRALDFTVAILAIIFLSPIILIAALMVKISSSGPVIFKQERIGLHRKKFVIYKFRSMKVQDEEKEKYGWTTGDDPRKTKFGTFIRKTSIDELPQLFNVLKGDMSIIGPRPERSQFVEKFREDIPKYMIKHHVRPGMTGWAQVNGWRGNTSIKKRIEYDIYYVENWNLLMDVKIFFMTFIKGFVNKNAY